MFETTNQAFHDKKKPQVQIRKSTNLGRVPPTNYLRLTSQVGQKMHQ
jgi:hypothetical protein